MRKHARWWGMARLLPLLVFALLALAAPASASVGGYDGTDGVLDTAGTTQTDATGGGDDILSGKELAPSGWDLTTGAASGKADFSQFGYAVTETAGDSFLYLHFGLVGDTGNVHAGFELHQSRAAYVTNSGDAVPCRTDGDVLIAYDGNATEVALAVYRWDGVAGSGTAACPDGGEGEWLGGDAGATAEGRLAGSFGEAAIDLSGLAALLDVAAPCEYFTSVSAHSRNSGSSETAQLGDIVSPLDLSVASCSPGDPAVTPPSAPTLVASGGCHADGAVTLSGTAAEGSQVRVFEEGSGTVGVVAIPEDADVGARGPWSLELTGVSHGIHTYTADARNSDGGDPPSFSEASADNPTVEVSVDSAAPAVTVTAAAGRSGEASFAGTAEPGSTITIAEGDAVVATVAAAADGAWSAIVTASAGEHSYVVRAADACGNSATAGDSDGDGSDGVRLTVTPAQSGNLGDGDGDSGDGGDGGGSDDASGGSDAGAASGTGDAGAPEGGGTAGECATKRFRVLVSKDEKRVKRVTFLVDGKRLKIVRKRDAQGRFTAMVDPSRFKAGRHQIVAKLKLRGGKVRKVKHRSFTVCGYSKCTSRMKFWMPIRRVPGDAYASATATVAGKQAKVTRRGGRLGVRVNLIGKPKGAYKVRARAVTESGRTVTRTRTLLTCGLKKPA